MSDHTPGPWSCHGVTFEDCNRNSAAYIIECAGGMPASRANAHLIASAPELLGALEAMVLNDHHTYRDCHKRAIATIAKARGQ